MFFKGIFLMGFRVREGPMLQGGKKEGGNQRRQGGYPGQTPPPFPILLIVIVFLLPQSTLGLRTKKEKEESLSSP